MTNAGPIPAMGFGTYRRTGDAGLNAILIALETGYRHLDTAQSYNTERECGEALRRSGLKRDAVFVTTKIDMSNFASGKLIPSLSRSLDALELAAVDLTLIHWPVPETEVPMAVYLEQLAEAQALGLTRKAVGILGPGRIVNNQVEVHPYLQNRDLVEHCERLGISVTCYLPIARGKLGEDPVLQAVAARHDATVEQVALAFSLQRGLVVIPTSGNAERIVINFAAGDIRLSDADMAAIAGIDRGYRMVNPATAPAWD
jgi:2,5-diketo-D-gluconate reductase B